MRLLTYPLTYVEGLGGLRSLGFIALAASITAYWGTDWTDGTDQRQNRGGYFRRFDWFFGNYGADG